MNLHQITFRDINNYEWTKNPGPSNWLDSWFNKPSIDADINNSKTKDDEEHDMFCILPEHTLLTEQILMGQSEQKETKAKDFNQNLKKLQVVIGIIIFDGYSQKPRIYPGWILWKCLLLVPQILLDTGWWQGLSREDQWTTSFCKWSTSWQQRLWVGTPCAFLSWHHQGKQQPAKPL